LAVFVQVSPVGPGEVPNYPREQPKRAAQTGTVIKGLTRNHGLFYGVPAQKPEDDLRFSTHLVISTTPPSLTHLALMVYLRTARKDGCILQSFDLG